MLWMVQSENKTTSWAILQAEICKNLSQAKISRWTECGNKDQKIRTNTELKLLCFVNPPRTNLCFSNAVTSSLLNIPILGEGLSNITQGIPENRNKIIEELVLLSNELNYEKASTTVLRNIITSLCYEQTLTKKDYNNNAQHDAGEFLQSVLEHLFENDGLPQFFD